MENLSICLIVKNEEKRITDCLNSFKELSNQFIIVDTGSSDNTKKLAEQFGAKVFFFPWKNDFSAARNYAIGKNLAEWTMMIDADNRPDKGSCQKIKKILNKKQKNNLIYLECEFQNTFSYLPKIWRTQLNLKYKYPVHEYLETDQTKNLYLKNAKILHLSQKSYLKSRKYYIEIMENFIKKNPQDLRMLYYLVSDNRYLGRNKEVIKWGKKYLQFSDLSDEKESSRILFYLGTALINLNSPQKAEILLRAAIELDPTFITPYISLGDLKFAEKNFDAAIQFFKKALKCEEDELQNFYSNDDAQKKYAENRINLAKSKQK